MCVSIVLHTLKVIYRWQFHSCVVERCQSYGFHLPVNRNYKLLFFLLNFSFLRTTMIWSVHLCIGSERILFLLRARAHLITSARTREMFWVFSNFIFVFRFSVSFQTLATNKSDRYVVQIKILSTVLVTSWLFASFLIFFKYNKVISFTFWSCYYCKLFMCDPGDSAC